MIAAFIFTVVSVIGTLLTTVQAALTSRFRRRERPFADGLREQASRQDDSLISILKPVCGLDDELEENLLSFVSLRGVRYEVIVSIEGREDPAIPVVQRVMRRHPSAPFKVVIGQGTRNGVVNRKIERLIAAARVARGDIFFISDSNVRVLPDDIARTVEQLRSSGAGCISNIFTASGSKDAGATLEAVHLLSFVMPGAVLAAAAGVPCVVGKSMGITRAALNAVGGFEAFRHVLAEDQAIGMAVKRRGFDVILSPVVVRNVIVKRTIGRALARQIRWNKIRYSFSRSLYASEIALNPFPLACAAAVFGSPWQLPAVVLLARLLQVAVLRMASHAPMRLHEVLAAPLHDFLMLYGWLVPFFSNQVEWRGYRARLGRGTELIQAA